MNHHHDAFNTASPKPIIEKLFQIGNQAAYLSCQIQEITTMILRRLQPDPKTAPAPDPDLTGKV